MPRTAVPVLAVPWKHIFTHLRSLFMLFSLPDEPSGHLPLTVLFIPSPSPKSLPWPPRVGPCSPLWECFYYGIQDVCLPVCFSRRSLWQRLSPPFRRPSTGLSHGCQMSAEIRHSLALLLNWVFLQVRLYLIFSNRWLSSFEVKNPFLYIYPPSLFENLP